MLAEEQGVSVESSEVDQLIAIQKEQNRLGSSDKVFEDTLKDFFAWNVQTIADF